MNTIIVSRHASAVDFLVSELSAPNVSVTLSAARDAMHIIARNEYGEDEFHGTIPILASAAPDDVRGKIVYGNLPLHLAALAEEVRVIEFAGAAPRGQEYTLADMKAAGACVRRYMVAAL